MFQSFNIQSSNHLTSKMFFDDTPSIARFDKQKYPFLEKLTRQQLGFFWIPEEVDLSKDARDFKELEKHEKHIFTSNLKRQILLDSVQGRAPTVAFGPIASLPELENWIVTWTFSETIHSRSYTHIIRNVYTDPSSVLDSILDIQEIIDCANDISYQYDKLIEMNTKYQFGHEVLPYEHKKALWLALVSVNILEGIRFYVSFACSWAFAELKKMEGNAKIIKLICRDENLHLAGTQQILKTLVQDDEDFKNIREETTQEVLALFKSAAIQEMEWAKYLFKNGTIIGLNDRILSEYIQWLTNKRLKAIEYPVIFEANKQNPIPWINKWVSGSEIQVAPQETQITSYILGGIKKDITSEELEKLKKFAL